MVAGLEEVHGDLQPQEAPLYVDTIRNLDQARSSLTIMITKALAEAGNVKEFTFEETRRLYLNRSYRV